MGLKVLIVASEVSPYAKSGGLGDVSGSLPKALIAAGVDARVVLPKYKGINPCHLEHAQYKGSFVVNLGWRTQSASVYQLAADVPTYVIENDFYFNRDGFYGYGDDNERFAFFSKASIELLSLIDFKPDVVHCNDWQTGPLPVYMRDIYSKFVYFSEVKTLFTIHNLQYQGNFPKESLFMMGLHDGYASDDKLEFYGNISYMKGGVLFADAVSTVSKTYAYEIQTPQYGYGLDGVLRRRAGDLTGIVNGIDYEANKPETSKKIYQNFSVFDYEGKVANKHALQKELGLPVCDAMMIGLISRLVDQKGIELIAQAMDELIQKDIQLVVLGTGDGRYEHLFRHYAYKCPDKVSAHILFDDTLAQKIYASSDVFLMPSLFEPCGLGQLFAMSYGTVPIVRTTGGLVDTVKHFNSETYEGNGFLFQDYMSTGMMWAINEALKTYHDKHLWYNVFKNAIDTRFSWDQSALEYIELYEKICHKSVEHAPVVQPTKKAEKKEKIEKTVKIEQEPIEPEPIEEQEV